VVFQDRLDPAFFFRRLPREQGKPGAAIARQCEQQIVPDGMRLEHRRLLEFAADPSDAIAGSSSSSGRCPLATQPARYPAGSLPVITSIHGRLAGAVGADHCPHLALVQRE